MCFEMKNEKLFFKGLDLKYQFFVFQFVIGRCIIRVFYRKLYSLDLNIIEKLFLLFIFYEIYSKIIVYFRLNEIQFIDFSGLFLEVNKNSCFFQILFSFDFNMLL